MGRLGQQARQREADEGSKPSPWPLRGLHSSVISARRGEVLVVGRQRDPIDCRLNLQYSLDVIFHFPTARLASRRDYRRPGPPRLASRVIIEQRQQTRESYGKINRKMRRNVAGQNDCPGVETGIFELRYKRDSCVHADHGRELVSDIQHVVLNKAAEEDSPFEF
jgi:hypothetical protein